MTHEQALGELWMPLRHPVPSLTHQRLLSVALELQLVQHALTQYETCWCPYFGNLALHVEFYSS